MKRFVLTVSLILLLLPAAQVLAAVDLCAYVGDGMTAASVDTDSDLFEANEDVYRGIGDNWKSHEGYKRYILEGEPGPLPPDQVVERIDMLVALIESSRTFAAENGPALRDRLLVELESLRGRVVPLQAQTVVSWQKEKIFVDTAFDQTDGESVCDGTKYSSNSAFLEDSVLAPPLVLQIDQAVPVAGLETFEDFKYLATLEQAVEIRAVISEVQKIFASLQLVAVNRTAKRLHVIDKAWSNYLEKGYSQYPWESLLNSYVGEFTWTEAPKSQWVLLHPEVAALADIRSSSGASLEGALLLHGLGYIRYFGDKRNWFAGLSATASLTTDESFGAGGGATIHFGHTSIHKSVPHVSLGILWHDFEEGSNGPVLGISLDFWRLLHSDSAEELYRKASDKVRSVAGG